MLGIDPAVQQEVQQCVSDWRTFLNEPANADIVNESDFRRKAEELMIQGFGKEIVEQARERL